MKGDILFMDIRSNIFLKIEAKCKKKKNAMQKTSGNYMNNTYLVEKV
jgi:hypothetical protein